MGGDTNQRLINTEYSTLLSSVTVGVTVRNDCHETCDLQAGENTVILKFDFLLSSCIAMFKEIGGITEADLSSFDASNVVSMDDMFRGCPDLVKVDFTNINTPKLVQIQNIFMECRNLKSIDLSDLDFNVLQTTYGMFFGCSGLEKVILSNIYAPSLLQMGTIVSILLFFNISRFIQC